MKQTAHNRQTAKTTGILLLVAYGVLSSGFTGSITAITGNKLKTIHI